MPEPVIFDIAVSGSVWEIRREGRRVGVYSRLEEATHAAVALARELEQTGEPARVFVDAHDKRIEIDAGPEVTLAEEGAPLSGDRPIPQ